MNNDKTHASTKQNFITEAHFDRIREAIISKVYTCTYAAIEGGEIIIRASKDLAPIDWVHIGQVLGPLEVEIIEGDETVWCGFWGANTVRLYIHPKRGQT